MCAGSCGAAELENFLATIVLGAGLECRGRPEPDEMIQES